MHSTAVSARADALPSAAELKALGEALAQHSHHAKEDVPEELPEFGSHSQATAPPPHTTLKDHLRLDYDAFCQVRDGAPPALAALMRGSDFAHLPRDGEGCVAAAAVHEYVCARVQVGVLRCQLSTYDVDSADGLTEEQLENYVFDLMPELPPLQALEDEFVPFFVFHAVRKLLFSVGSRAGRVPIPALAASPALAALHDLKSAPMPGKGAPRLPRVGLHTPPGTPPPAGPLASRWFSPASAIFVYNAYLTLDSAGTGMLSAKELGAYGSGSWNSVFLDALLSEVATFQEGVLDYKGYLDFVLAAECRHTLPGMRYAFRVLDRGAKGLVSHEDIHYFFRGINAKLAEAGEETVPPASILTELLDMVSPAAPEDGVTMQDLLRCRMGPTFLHCLTDVRGFWLYSNRELLMHSEEDSSGQAHSSGGL